MQQVSAVIQQNQTGQTKQSETTYRSSEEMFVFIWRGLQAGKKISKDELVGKTDYKYWRYQLRDLTNTELKKGLDSTSDFLGFLGWSEFKKLCRHVDQSTPAHSMYLPKPAEEYIGGTEHHRRSAIMKAELGL